MDFTTLTVKQLKEQLRTRRLSTDGRKADLLSRLDVFEQRQQAEHLRCRRYEERIIKSHTLESLTKLVLTLQARVDSLETELEDTQYRCQCSKERSW